MLNKGSSFAELHTLASIYAVEGKTKEARETLLQAMKSANLSLPNSEVWYVLGSIYEQYGVDDAAIEAYKKVDKPEGFIFPTSTYILAQTRLKALASNPPATH
jgi:tetratricopeptide (TPR) repeat protein